MATNKNIIQNAVQNGVQAQKPIASRPIDRLKSILNAESVQEQFRNVLKENSGAFLASIIDLYNNDTYLQACDPKMVVMEALKAASLMLPLNKQLGFSFLVPYKDKNGNFIPTFQIGYKGYIQLAMRTSVYKIINTDIVYEGELVKFDKLTGEIVIDASQKISDKKIGYFAYFETINGFRKTIYKTVDEIIQHAKKYSKSYGTQYSPWQTDFDAMALKTCLRILISKYGIMSVELLNGLEAEIYEEHANTNTNTNTNNNEAEAIEVMTENKKNNDDIWQDQ